MVDVKTLHLNLYGFYFNMILSGEKKEEYRCITPYWKKRMMNARNNNIDNITFSNGYSAKRRQMVVELRYITIRTGIEEWGAKKGVVYFVLRLDKIISTKNI